MSVLCIPNPTAPKAYPLRSKPTVLVFHPIIISEQPNDYTSCTTPCPMRSHNMEHEDMSWQGASSNSLSVLTGGLCLRICSCVFIYCTVVKSMCLESDCMGWNRCDLGQVTFFILSFSLCRKRIIIGLFRRALMMMK